MDYEEIAFKLLEPIYKNYQKTGSKVYEFNNFLQLNPNKIREIIRWIESHGFLIFENTPANDGYSPKSRLTNEGIKFMKDYDPLKGLL